MRKISLKGAVLWLIPTPSTISHLEFGESMSPFLGSLMWVLSVRVSDPQECRGGSWAGWGVWAQKRLCGQPAHPQYVKAKTVSLGPDGKDGKCQPFLKTANFFFLNSCPGGYLNCKCGYFWAPWVRKYNAMSTWGFLIWSVILRIYPIPMELGLINK